MRSEPEIRQLRAFVAVVDTGGFTRAAAALGVSQSTASETVHALERVLGTALFVKGRRRPMLTLAGEQLLPAARRVLAAVEAAVRVVVEAEAEARATVALGTSESISAYLLPAVLAQARREWPGTRYVVSTDSCAALRGDVRAGRLELGLVLGTAAGGDEEETERLAKGHLLFFAGPEHPLAGREAAVDRIAATTLYLSDAAGDFWELVRDYFGAAGFPAHRLQSAGSVEGVKRGVQADPEALGLLPAYTVEEEVARGEFARVVPTVPLPPIWLAAVWRRGTTLSPRARAISDRLRAADLCERCASGWT